MPFAIKTLEIYAFLLYLKEGTRGSPKLFSHTGNAPAYTAGAFCFEILNIKFEVVLCVVVRNIFYNLGENAVILGEFSVFHPVAKEIAEDASEVFVSGVGQEASGICQHTDKTGKISEVGKGNQLILHACFMVIEPPCAALLNLGYSGGILEAAQNGADGLVVTGIQAVKDGPGKLVCYIQGVEEICHLRGRSIIVDAVITGIRAQLFVH